MQAVILAGGLATRLHPRTLRVPKSMLPVAGRPFVDWQLEALQRSGYDEVILCVGHLGATIIDHVGDGLRYGVRATYSEDGPRLLGTAGALRKALPLLEETFLVTYGDSYLPFDYAAPLADLREHPDASATMSVYANQGRWDASNCQVEGERVVRYQKGSPDPALDHIDYGAIALRRSVIAELPADEPADLAALQARLASSGRLRAYAASERFFEMGSEQGLLALEAHLRQS